MTNQLRWAGLTAWIVENIRDFVASPDNAFYGETLKHANSMKVEIIRDENEDESDDADEDYYQVFINDHEISADLGTVIHNAWNAEIKRRQLAAEEEILARTIAQVQGPARVNLSEQLGVKLNSLYTSDALQLWQLHQDNIHTTTFSKLRGSMLTFSVGDLSVGITADSANQRFVATIRRDLTLLTHTHRAELPGILAEIKQALISLQSSTKD